MSKKLKIVFLGTPEFAVASLQAIVEAGYEVVGVITAPDRMGGRGMKQVIESDVKKYAVSQGLKIMQPKNLKNEAFQNELRALNADIQIVVAFRMLPVAVWDMPPLGTYNLHGSLLPQYRGAAPINWAIMNGETVTGVTTFKLKHKIDTGSIAYQERVEVLPGDYLDDVYSKLMHTGASLILKTLEDIEDGSIELTEQDDSKVCHAPKIFHKDCLVDFEKESRDVYNFIRGLSPYPTAWTKLGDKKLKIFKIRYAEHHHSEPTGEYISNGKSYLAITTQNGVICLDELQLEGKRRMKVAELLNGLNLKSNKTELPIRILPHWSHLGR